MKVCSVCNEIVSANQRCALSNCPNKGSARPAPKSGKVTPGPTGRSDRAVQAGLDRAGDVARNATRRAAFAITVIFAVIVAIAAIGFNFWSGTPPTSTNAPAAIEASPQAMVSEGGAASAGAAAASAGDAVDAMAYAGKYPSERIDGYGIFDAPDLQAAVKGMPEGNQIWAQITSESRVLDVESPNRVSDGGQSIVIQKCEAHNCGGPSSRQFVLKYFTPSNGRTGQAAVCLKNGASRQIYLSWGIGDLGAEMPGDECTEESFDYVD